MNKNFNDIIFLRAAFREFVEVCLNKDPANRPTAKELLQHHFLRKDHSPMLQIFKTERSHTDMKNLMLSFSDELIVPCVYLYVPKKCRVLSSRRKNGEKDILSHGTDREVKKMACRGRWPRRDFQFRGRGRQRWTR